MKKSLMLTWAVLFFGSTILSAIDVDSFSSTETIIVDSFDTNSVYPGSNDPIEWQVTASKATAPDYPKSLLANTWPKDKFGDQPDNAADLRALAVNGSFVRRGDNWIEIVPTRGGTATPLPLTGEVVALGVWVWGSNYNYDLDAVFMDSEGIEHRLTMGSLKFMGWQNMNVSIPSKINQSSDRFPIKERLKFVKFIVSTNPSEKVDNFYLYLDHITTFSKVRSGYAYDGSDLTQDVKLVSIWGERVQPAITRANTGNEISATSPEANPAIGSDNAAFQKLQEVSVSKMQDPVFWNPIFSSDFGYVAVKSFQNTPSGKQPIAGEQEANAGGESGKVLGTRIQFIRRGRTSFTLKAVRPLPIEGVVKVVSVWVAGRNVPHNLTLLVRDYRGNIKELPMGKLNFSGWKQMSVAIPSTILQNDPRYSHRVGMSIEGFRVDFDLNETGGSYYIYMDDLRALTDVYAVTESQDDDDPDDQW